MDRPTPAVETVEDAARVVVLVLPVVLLPEADVVESVVPDDPVAMPPVASVAVSVPVPAAVSVAVPVAASVAVPVAPVSVPVPITPNPVLVVVAVREVMPVVPALVPVPVLSVLALEPVAPTPVPVTLPEGDGASEEFPPSTGLTADVVAPVPVVRVGAMTLGAVLLLPRPCVLVATGKVVLCCGCGVGVSGICGCGFWRLQ